jgi:predicted HTH transcriptional regulator
MFRLKYWNTPMAWTIQTLIDKHSSKPFNPDIANALFRSGYIESWGRGISKMTEQCFDFGLPAPLFFFKSSGFGVEFRKDIYNYNQIKNLELNERQIEAVLFIKEKRKINNNDFQTLNDVSKATATRDLAELVEKFIRLELQGVSLRKYIYFYAIVLPAKQNCLVGSTSRNRGAISPEYTYYYRVVIRPPSKSLSRMN